MNIVNFEIKRVYAEENFIEKSKAQNVTDLIQNTINIEVGGCYCGDYIYVAFGDDVIVNVDCGIWD